MAQFVDNIFGIALVGEEDGFSMDEWNQFKVVIDDDLWARNCAILERSIDEGGLGIEHMICVYSRPQNLRDLLQKAKLYQLGNKEASTYCRG